MENHGHYYIMYGIVVYCNIHLPLLNETVQFETVDLKIDVSYASLSGSADRVQIRKNSDGLYSISLGQYAVYNIDFSNKMITCTAESFESFFSTLFNVPFSVYFALAGEILLHSCSMFFNGSLICFAGEKGVGKSTLTNMLNGEKFRLYSDDTVRVTAERLGIRAHDLIKLTQETVGSFNIPYVMDEKNIAEKYYGRIPFSADPAPVKAIVQLSRTNGEASIERITSTQMKKLIYLGNIVGANFYNSDLLDILVSTSFGGVFL